MKHKVNETVLKFFSEIEFMITMMRGMKAIEPPSRGCFCSKSPLRARGNVYGLTFTLTSMDIGNSEQSRNVEPLDEQN